MKKTVAVSVLILALTACQGAPPPQNRPPTVTLNASTTRGTAPLSVNFTTSAADPDGDALTYAWTFGDGNDAPAGSSQAHIYTSAGTYTARVTVSDGEFTASDEAVITVEAPNPAAVPYYGEWRWMLELEGDSEPFEGKLSISEIAPASDEFQDGGRGAWTWCPTDPCGEPDGTGTIGTFAGDAGERLKAQFVVVDADGSSTRMIAFDDDNSLGTEAQGRDTFLGQGTWFSPNGTEARGTLTLYRISGTPEIPSPSP